MTETTEAPDSYEAAFYDICALLGIPAMPISPQDAYRDVVRPRIVGLLDKQNGH